MFLTQWLNFIAQKTLKIKELIETFKLRTENLVENNDFGSSLYGENKTMDCVTVMDGVSNLADTCKEIAGFLTITRKYCYHCIYIFHIIILDRDV